MSETHTKRRHWTRLGLWLVGTTMRYNAVEAG